MEETHKKLTAQERDLIAVWKAGGVRIREIARRLGRSPGTISDELRRNMYQGTYVAIHAQARTEARKLAARKRHPLKDAKTYSYVLGKLEQGWSPELIAGRLKRKHKESIICHETIYDFIYALENKDKKLWEYLPLKRIRRKRKLGRGVQRERIPDRVSIHDRPEKINQRSEFGHFEGDTVEGKGHRDGIHTEVERLSRKTFALKVARIASEETVTVQEEIFGSLPSAARRSTTLDNGKENHLHTRLTKKLHMKIYFADPYSSWQRGTNEYHNGLIRRYLPKGTSFTHLTQGELDDIVFEINNRPRKCLDFQTPEEVFNSYITTCSDST